MRNIPAPLPLLSARQKGGIKAAKVTKARNATIWADRLVVTFDPRRKHKKAKAKTDWNKCRGRTTIEISPDAKKHKGSTVDEGGKERGLFHDVVKKK